MVAFNKKNYHIIDKHHFSSILEDEKHVFLNL